MSYNREKAVEYAHKWAFGRNPAYLNFTGIGGDCTNFVSQCLFAGGARMNFTKDYGWYYISPNNRAPAWTSVEFLYRFLMNNNGIGPFGELVEVDEIEPGDIVQLSNSGIVFSHTLLVVETDSFGTLDDILIAAHTYDSDYRPLSTYAVADIRFIKIDAR